MKGKLKLISFLLLIINIFCLKEAKDFLKEFIKTTKGKVIDNFPEQCLGKFFEYHFLLLKKNYKENNFEQLLKNIENIAIDIFLNCPNYELISIFNETDFEKMSSLPSIQVYKNIFILGTKFYSIYKNETLTGSSLGKLFGDIINMFKENVTDIKELKSDKNTTDINSYLDNIEQYFDIIGGIFIGMKEKDDGNESKCYNDIIKGKSKIIEHIKDGIKNMDKDKGIGKMITKILFNLITVEGLVVDCNLLSFGSNIISKITSIKDMTELFNSVMQNNMLYLLYLEQIVDSFKKNDMKNLGKYIGKILSNLFDFHVK